MVQHAINF